MKEEGRKTHRAKRESLVVAAVESFEFDSARLKEAKKVVAKYPEGRQASAVMPLLWLAQEQCSGFISQTALDYVANFLEMRPIRVYEIATSYTMYNTAPVGKYLIQVCRTTPCWLCGCDDILKTCQEILGIGIGETTKDKLFTLKEVECLGACVNAPVVQINNDYYENLTPQALKDLLLRLQGDDN